MGTSYSTAPRGWGPCPTSGERDLVMGKVQPFNVHLSKPVHPGDLICGRSRAWGGKGGRQVMWETPMPTDPPRPCCQAPRLTLLCRKLSSLSEIKCRSSSTLVAQEVEISRTTTECSAMGFKAIWAWLSVSMLRCYAMALCAAARATIRRRCILWSPGTLET